MKVDVNIIRRPGVKVEVNLARGRRNGTRVSVPVRVAPYLAEDFPEDGLSAAPDEYELTEAPEAAEEAAEAEAQTFESELPEEESIEEDCAVSDQYEDYGDADDYDNYDEYEEYEEYDEPQEDIPEEEAPDEEELLRLIAEEEAELAASGLAPDPDELQLPEGHYMRYLDRSEDGELHEVNDSAAAGRKIICVDSESGKISRVCGFIKRGGSDEQ